MAVPRLALVSISILALLLALPIAIAAQPAHAYRLAVVHVGGPTSSSAIDGLRGSENWASRTANSSFSTYAMSRPM
jgi:hypothetical protein